MQYRDTWAGRLLRDRLGIEIDVSAALLRLAEATIEVVAAIVFIMLTLLMLAFSTLIIAADIWQMLSLDLLAPTAAQVLDPEFSLEGVMAQAQEVR